MPLHWSNSSWLWHSFVTLVKHSKSQLIQVAGLARRLHEPQRDMVKMVTEGTMSGATTKPVTSFSSVWLSSHSYGHHPPVATKAGPRKRWAPINFAFDSELLRMRTTMPVVGEAALLIYPDFMIAESTES